MSGALPSSADDFLVQTLQATSECAAIDFKASFDPSESPQWVELIKDIVAMANSGGRVILIGLQSEGTLAGTEVSSTMSVDPADVTNKIYKYTDQQFHAFTFRACSKASQQVCAITVKGIDIPIVFTKPGTYAVDASKQKTAFSAGTVYFRHGAKSEPGNSEDLRAFVDRRIETIRTFWMEGIAKVVEAPSGARIAVLPPEVHDSSEPTASPIRLVDDPSAPAYYAMPVDTTHPHRQKEVTQLVNAKLKGKKAITAYDIQCVRKAFDIDSKPSFCYTQKYASPR